MSGLQQRGRTYRFVTLALGPDGTPAELQRAWHRLVERLRRRHLLQDFIKVVERGPANGSLHIHVLYTGKYIDAYVLRDHWIAVSGARYVWISRLKGSTPRKAANEVSKYMGKDPLARCAYSRHWAFPRLAAYWQEWKRLGRTHGVTFELVLIGWQHYCARGDPPPILLPGMTGVGRGSTFELHYRRSHGRVRDLRTGSPISPGSDQHRRGSAGVVRGPAGLPGGG